MTMTMIGYGQYQYTVKNSATPVTWPILGVALEKNYLSFHSSVYRDDQPFGYKYVGRLGRAKVNTKGVVIFTSLDGVDREAFTGLVTAIAAGLASGELIAR